MNKLALLQRGFTLIELLVVIAIIGILAAVVIGSLNDARSGGQNASIQQSMANLRSQAELYYNGDGSFSYEGVCGDAAIISGVNAALDVVNGNTYAAPSDDTTVPGNSDTTATDRDAACQDNESQYVIQAPLANSADRFWCVDSTGASRETAAIAASAFVCPAS